MLALLRADVCYLIAEEPARHGVFDQPTETTERMVYCTVRSVSSADYWRAHEQGLNPEVVFELADYYEYEGERLIRWDGRTWSVIRTYVDGIKIELTCEEARAYDQSGA